MPLLGSFNVPGIKKKDKKPPRIPLPDIDSLKDAAKIVKKLQAREGHPLCVLLTQPILFDQAKGYEVKDVRFTLNSNDQGWCDEDNFPGDYEGSWTWFEVAILRTVEGQVTKESPKDERSLASKPFVGEYLNSLQIIDRMRFVIPERKTTNGPFWHLQRNRRGRYDAYEHKLVWTRDAKEFDLERVGWEFDSASGQGSGLNFASSLESGDRILLVARCEQSEWINNIFAVSIEVTFQGFVPLDSEVPGKPETPQMNDTHHVTHNAHTHAGSTMPPVAGQPHPSIALFGLAPDSTTRRNRPVPVMPPSPTEARSRKRSIGVPTSLTWIVGPRSSTKADKEKTGEVRQGVPMRSSNTISAPSSSLMGAPVTEGLAIGSASVVSLPSPTAKERAKMFFGISNDMEEGSSSRRANTTVSITEESDSTISAADLGNT